MLPILIVDDEPSIAQLIAMTLEPLGQPLILAHNGERAADLLETQKFDLVILDVMLPGVDGFALMDYIAPTGTPVVFLTAKNAVADRVRGLKLGAYDYIVKPFSPNELVARVKGHLARYEQLTSREVHRDVLHYGDLEIDESGHRVFVKGKEVTLPNKEFELLLFFAKNPGIVFSKETLFDRVWGSEALGETATVSVHVNRIREKIEEDTANPRYIETVWGAGYRFRG